MDSGSNRIVRRRVVVDGGSGSSATTRSKQTVSDSTRSGQARWRLGHRIWDNN
ncbi:hypothetical protein C2845_PM11G20280 [Panicum miliaceum]|uniref:Uncharacterized protein n=1 Tax=Panicum miliaceum TaxID=4540 RepID=A0A3L6RU76_PANMI|nr:hypothetical protein C2845_PM11G20280 [Panicum miliaceum]